MLQLARGPAQGVNVVYAVRRAEHDDPLADAEKDRTSHRVITSRRQRRRVYFTIFLEENTLSKQRSEQPHSPNSPNQIYSK